MPAAISVSKKAGKLTGVVPAFPMLENDNRPAPDTAAAAATGPKEVFTTEGAARFLGVSKQLLELLRLVGGGPRYAKLGRLVRYRRIALDDWLSEHERDHTADRK